MDRSLKEIFFALYVIGMSAGCSSAGKITHYQFEQPQKTEVPRLKYEQTDVFDPNLASVRGYTLKYIYLEKNGIRFIQLSRFQYAALRFKDYGYKTYSWGPIFLPIIPNFNFVTEQEMDLEAPLEFALQFYSDPVFERVTATLPDLEIMTADGKILKPIVSESSNGFAKNYKFDAKIKNVPWFILREAKIKLSNNKALQIPETKFTLKSEFEIDWSIPIGP